MGGGHTASFIVSSFSEQPVPFWSFKQSSLHTIKPSKIRSIGPPFSRTTDASQNAQAIKMMAA